MLTRTVATLRGFWDDAQGYQRLAYLVGAALIAVGLIHAGFGALTGESASGPLSWRKPATFGISFGITTATLGWVALYLPIRRRIGWVVSGLLSASITFEVGWVTVQHARGVPSHFNNATPLDEALFILGAIAISVAILDDIRGLRNDNRTPADGLGDPLRASCAASGPGKRALDAHTWAVIAG
jgi:hypothetical protein